MFSPARPGNSNPKQRIQNPTALPSSSSSASSCSSPPPSPPQTATSAAVAATPTATMEELWKDINPSPLHHPYPSYPHPYPPHHHHHYDAHHPSSAAAAASHGMKFQDFLGPPPPPAAMLGPYHPGHHPLSAPGAADPSPATLLSLNSGMEYHFLEDSSPLQSSSGSGHLQSGLTNVVSSASFNGGWPFEAAALANSSPVLPCFGPRKRNNDPETETGDRRHKRMIKNRESAARSRARKQAYTNELELEVAHLSEENTKLKEQQQQWRMAQRVQTAKKHKLQRSTTAPF